MSENPELSTLSTVTRRKTKGGICGLTRILDKHVVAYSTQINCFDLDNCVAKKLDLRTKYQICGQSSYNLVILSDANSLLTSIRVTGVVFSILFEPG